MDKLLKLNKDMKQIDGNLMNFLNMNLSIL